MSIDAIKLINEYGIPCVVLTKGILPIELAELSDINQYGITLVSLDEGFREEMEPGAASLADRLAALKTLSDAGCKTWVSMEPYPPPNVHEQELQPILETVSFTNQIVFGRVHYDRRTSAYEDLDAFYRGAAEQVARVLREERYRLPHQERDGGLVAVLLKHKKSPTHRAFPGVDRSLPDRKSVV